MGGVSARLSFILGASYSTALICMRKALVNSTNVENAFTPGVFLLPEKFRAALFWNKSLEREQGEEIRDACIYSLSHFACARPRAIYSRYATQPRLRAKQVKRRWLCSSRSELFPALHCLC
ncbi:hypothetical protein QQF64_022307 [Cirrhinus molitorella]|uniref:Uncharacterized protein n=1 Tax=Cirrhinus molitorella TaxID=172907 RepID=A0ABR3L7U7_9TELE